VWIGTYWWKFLTMKTTVLTYAFKINQHIVCYAVFKWGTAWYEWPHVKFTPKNPWFHMWHWFFALSTWVKPRFWSYVFVSGRYSYLYIKDCIYYMKNNYWYINTWSLFYHHTKHGRCTTEIQYLSEHPVTAAMLNTAVEETCCIICIGLLKSLEFHVAAD
jgi:hypothetical protein